MKERKLEIETQRELLNGKKKTLDENRICLKRTIDHLNTRIGQLEKRYEIVMNLLGKSDDGEQMSVTHFKIRSAQEKHELQEKGDELEAKINKTEEEILAMENTLRLVSLTNDNFKTNLDSVEDDSKSESTWIFFFFFKLLPA
ncbi:hypothetical protein AAG570_000885 [Ranatra chinensis]|uniref:Coiled-coil domain-containing protein 39 n=1 Tax=Ranatra chinensis TaxID=642074 RepID=A0ABD0Z0G5_9HEMI